MRSQRIDEVYEYIFEQKRIGIEELCEHFAISKSTLRRDLDELTKRGLVKKVYGGVMSAESRRTQTPAYSKRHVVNAEGKQRIAEKAASLVRDGDIIFIDSGSTNNALVDYIVDRQHVTIVTNNVNVIMRALPYPELNVISLGGTMNRNTMSFTGEVAAHRLIEYNIAKAFMGTTGFSPESGVTNTLSTEIAIKKTAVEHSRQVYVLADHTKAGVVSLFTYAQFRQITALITDENLPDLEPFLSETGCELLVADKGD